MASLDLMSVGLAYDGVGVAVLGYAFFRTGVSSLYLNSVTFWGGNRGVLEASVAGRTDGVTGTALLVVGFVLQWLGVNDVYRTFVGGALVVLLATFLVGYVLIMRRSAINYQLRKADEFAAKWKEEGKAEKTK